MSIIYLIRHGQSEANQLRIWGGDFPLTEKGRQQAQTVAPRIPELPDKVISSTLKRANETARIAFPSYEVEKNPAFDEISFGDIELTPMNDESIWNLYCKDPEALLKKYNGDDCVARTVKAVEELKRYAGENNVTAVFMSDTIIRCILSYLKGQTLNDICGYYIVNCGIVRLEYDGGFVAGDSEDIVVRPGS